MMKKIFKQSFPYLVFLLVALFLTYIFSYKLKGSQFLLIGDQFIRFSYYEAFVNSFFIRKWDGLGVFNCWQLMAQFWDALYYLIIYKLGASLQVAEKLSFFLILFFSQAFAYAGFKRLKTLFVPATSTLCVFVVALWFSFNTYTLVLWHGGIYNLGVTMSAALVPLIFYYFYKSLFTHSALKDKIICAFLLFCASFTFWLFAVTVFFLIVFSLMYFLLNMKSYLLFLKNLGLLLTCYVPLAGIVIFTILHEYFNNVGDLNAVFNPTFGIEKGGLWYQFLMLFSWGMYNMWTPRSIYSFSEYFFTKKYIFSTILIYLVALVGLIKLFLPKIRQRIKLDSKDKVLAILVFIFGLALFFAKANQPPFGEAFVWMYMHVPFFSVFRSADHRFGFLVVLTLSTMLLLVSNKINKYIFFGLIFTVMIGQNIMFFNGTAMYGQNKKGPFYDRIVYISKDYQEVATAINSDNGSFGYILSLPPIPYGDYEFDKGEHLIGQDMLVKLVNKPFIYVTAVSSMSGQTASVLYTNIVNKDYKSLSNFPIKYILLRSDTKCEDCLNPPEQDLTDNFKLFLKNDTFSVYKNETYLPVVASPGSVFKVINPVKYKVQMKNVSQKTPLGLMLSFNKNWKVYVSPPDKNFCSIGKTVAVENSTQCLSDLRFFEGEEMLYNLASPSFEETRFLANNYANGWVIDPTYIKDILGKDSYTQNSDGSINFDLVIFYKPQARFYFFGTLSFLLLLGAGVFLFKEIKSVVKKG